MQTLLADARHSLRMMVKTPAFTVTALAAIALGIGANIGIFSVFDKVLLQPLPYPDPDRIVTLARKYPNGEGDSNSIPKFMTWRKNNTVFSAMALYDQGGPGLNLSGGDRPEQVKGTHVSADYFKVFGVQPYIGRTFSTEEDSPNGPNAAVISYSLWKSHFGGANMSGRTIDINGEAHPVIGIMPESFVSSPVAEIWIPLQADPNSTNQGHYLAASARLKPDVTLEQARGQMKLAGEAFRRLYPQWMDKNESVAVSLMGESQVRNIRLALIVLLSAVGAVLLIACANVANLLLARAAVRQRELCIRAALGASRGRVIRQLLTESMILSCIGGLLGFCLGIAGLRALLALAPEDIPRLRELAQTGSVFAMLDWRIAAFTFTVSLVTGILFGLVPALQISNPDVASTLKEASGRSSTGSRRHTLVRNSIVAIEMGLAVVLLSTAALLIRTFVALSHVDAGIDAHNVLTMQTSLAGQRYGTTQKVDTFTTQVLRRLESVPGIESAAAAIALPTDTGIDLPFTVVGRTPKGGQLYEGDEQWRSITPHYFDTFKVPLIAGRFFNERDNLASQRVVVINRAMAAKYWKNQNALGQVITIGKGLGPQFDDPPREVIGIVGNIHEEGLRDDELSAMYIPASQEPQGIVALANSALPLCWAIRSRYDSKALAGMLLREVQAVDSQMPISKIVTMEQRLSGQTARQNFNMMLLTVFAAIALILAAIGIYGLVSYSVERQTQELGIRMALGADQSSLVRLVVKQGMSPALIGVVAGLGAAFLVTRLMGRLLYGVKSYDPVSFAAVVVVLTAVALLAVYLPARRTMGLDPVIALRQE